MSARLGRSFDDDSSVDSREQFAKEDLDNKAGGLTDCLDGVAARLHFTFNQLEYFLFEPFGRRYQAELLKWGRRETIPPILQISDSLRF
jgi:hypothetical protein